MTDPRNTSQKSTKILTVIILIGAAFLLYGFFAGFRANFGMITTFISQMIPGLSYGDVNFLFFLFTIVNGLGTPIMGFLTIKKSNRFVLLLGCIFIALGMVGIAIASNIITLVIAIVFFLPLGSAALSYAVIFSLILPSLGVKAASIAAGVINCSSTFFAMLLAPTIAVLTQTIGFSTCIILFAIVALIFIPLALFLTHRQKGLPVTKEVKMKINFLEICKAIFRTPIFYILLGCYFVYGFCCQGVTNHLFAGMESAGLSSFSSSIILSLANLSMTIGMIAIGFIAIKFKKHLKLAIAIVTCVSIFQLLFFILVGVPLTEIILLIFICLLGGSLLPLASLVASESIDPLYLATALGILNFAGKISQGLNFEVGGLIADYTGNLSYTCFIQAIAAGIVALILIVSLVIKRKKSEKQTQKLR